VITTHTHAHTHTHIRAHTHTRTRTRTANAEHSWADALTVGYLVEYIQSGEWLGLGYDEDGHNLRPAGLGGRALQVCVRVCMCVCLNEKMDRERCWV